ncbi:type IV pilus biogenesis/stability protein PilW [uncultured Metabacillus sp.]|uniref:tetratricopeptide repeat protein n=1 Tax=uncultured Metabacillus sp. TaxID=2860135 RepID=UPI0026098B36|nr:tetratricopeptide repeat protein [uncultured Metabacillus sp.]
MSDCPTTNLLPGKYVKTILQNKKSLNPIIEENNQMLICKSCGRKGKYDVGMLVVNVDKEKNPDNISDTIQMTGYFRCKHCNDAGNWELPTNLLMFTMFSALPLGNSGQKQSTIGKNLLFDGSWHRYTTDAEEYLLNLLKENPQDSYVWNRLGNLYHKGNRPELAVSVFEHSILIDPGQTESHFTLGDMLAQISDLPNAGYHFRQMLLSAEAYKRMPAVKLREILANGLLLLFLMHDHTNGEVPFLPTLDEIKASGRKGAPVNLAEMELEIFPDDVDSFFPIAEMYMGVRAKEIPIREKTFNMMNSSKISLKQKKVKKKKKRK